MAGIVAYLPSDDPGFDCDSSCVSIERTCTRSVAQWLMSMLNKAGKKHTGAQGTQAHSYTNKK